MKTQIRKTVRVRITLTAPELLLLEEQLRLLKSELWTKLPNGAVSTESQVVVNNLLDVARKAWQQ